MTVHAALRTVLLRDARLVALVADRVFPDVLPQLPTYPAVVFARTGLREIGSHSGPSGLTRSVFMFDAWAATREEAEAVATVVRLVLCPEGGLRLRVDGCHLQGALQEPGSGVDQYDDNVKRYRRGDEFALWHSEEM